MRSARRHRRRPLLQPHRDLAAAARRAPRSARRCRRPTARRPPRAARPSVRTSTPSIDLDDVAGPQRGAVGRAAGVRRRSAPRRRARRGRGRRATAGSPCGAPRAGRARSRATLAGTAKLVSSPSREVIPTTRPSAPSSGPPEVAGSITASVSSRPSITKPPGTSTCSPAARIAAGPGGGLDAGGVADGHDAVARAHAVGVAELERAQIEPVGRRRAARRGRSPRPCRSPAPGRSGRSGTSPARRSRRSRRARW